MKQILKYKIYPLIREMSQRIFIIYIIFTIVILSVVDFRKWDLSHLDYLRGNTRYLRQLNDGRVAYNKMRIRLGIKYYETVKDKYPKCSFVYANLGFCHFFLGNYKQSIKILYKAIELNPSIYSFYMDLGTIYYRRGDPDMAYAYFEQALSHMVTTKEYFSGIAQILNQKGYPQLSLAINQYQKYIPADEKRLIHVLLDSYLILKKYKKFYHFLSSIPDQYSKDAQFQYYYGVLKYQQKEYDPAISCFNRAIEFDPQNKNAYYYRALCWQKKNAVEKYEADIKKVLFLDREDNPRHNITDLKLHLHELTLILMFGKWKR